MNQKVIQTEPNEGDFFFIFMRLLKKVVRLKDKQLNLIYY